MMTGELYPGEFEAMEHNGQMDAVADNGLKDLIDELREYGNARKGELAGMVLEAANRLEEMGMTFTEVGERLKLIDERLERITSALEAADQ